MSKFYMVNHGMYITEIGYTSKHRVTMNADNCNLVFDTARVQCIKVDVSRSDAIIFEDSNSDEQELHRELHSLGYKKEYTKENDYIVSYELPKDYEA